MHLLKRNAALSCGRPSPYSFKPLICIAQANLNPEGSLLELPSKDEFLEFFSFAGPAFFALLGKVVTFSSLTYAVAAAGTVSLAAHQVWRKHPPHAPPLLSWLPLLGLAKF
jgi:hypothetical protein